MNLAIAVFAAAAAVADPGAADPPDAVEAVEVTTRAPIVGDLQTGVSAYRPEYFVPARPSTAMDMITWLPGFEFEDTRPVRGLEGATGNVLIDGKPPTSKTDTLQSVLKRIPSSQVERVDLIVGGAPGIDMHGRSVIANVILKASARGQRTVTATSYTDLHGRVSPELMMTTSKKFEGRVLEGSLNLGRNSGVFPGIGYGSFVRRDAAGAVVFATDAYELVGGPFVIGSGSYEFPAASGVLKVSGLGRYFRGLWHEIDTLVPGPGEYSFDEDSNYKQGEFGLRYERTFGRTTLETQALERLTHHTTLDETVRPPAPITFNELDKESETIGRAVLRFKRDDKLTLEGSAEAALNGVDTASSRTVGGVFQSLPVANVSVHEQRGEVGGKLTWKPNDRYSLDAALKLEASDLTATGDTGLERRFAYLKPRLVFAWAPDKKTQLRLRGEREVGQVTFGSYISFSDVYSGQIRAGNTNLRPQRAWVAEAALERRFWTTGSLVLTLRRQILNDVIDNAPVRTSAGVVGAVSNIGTGHETDVVLNLTVPLKRLGLRDAILKGSINRTRRRVDDPISGLPRPITAQPEVMAEIHYTQDFPRQKLNWGVDGFYRGATTLYRAQGDDRVDGWPHLNVFVEYRPKPDLNLRLEVQNLPGVHTPDTIRVFSGLRDRSPLLYSDERRMTVGPVVMLRVRRTFD